VASIFTRIITGGIPGRIIWRDPTCIAMVDIRPLNRGHVLVIPIAEVDRWTDLPVQTAAHCTMVAHAVGRAQMASFAPERIGLMIAGFEVPHTHLHVVPLDHMGHLDFSQADADADPSDLDDVAEALRGALRSAGHPEVV
jgi:histidine triad (HIT) family protein